MNLHFRPAALVDARSLFEWRNDDLTRQMSKNSAPVDWEFHVGWLEKRLATSDPRIFIAEIQGHPAGVFRVDGEFISYTVAPSFRGKGVGLHILLEANRPLWRRSRLRFTNATRHPAR